MAIDRRGSRSPDRSDVTTPQTVRRTRQGGRCPERLHPHPAGGAARCRRGRDEKPAAPPAAPPSGLPAQRAIDDDVTQLLPQALSARARDPRVPPAFLSRMEPAIAGTRTKRTASSVSDFAESTSSRAVEFASSVYTAIWQPRGASWPHAKAKKSSAPHRHAWRSPPRPPPTPARQMPSMADRHDVDVAFLDRGPPVAPARLRAAARPVSGTPTTRLRSPRAQRPEHGSCAAPRTNSLAAPQVASPEQIQGICSLPLREARRAPSLCFSAVMFAARECPPSRGSASPVSRWCSKTSMSSRRGTRARCSLRRAPPSPSRGRCA